MHAAVVGVNFELRRRWQCYLNAAFLWRWMRWRAKLTRETENGKRIVNALNGFNGIAERQNKMTKHILIMMSLWFAWAGVRDNGWLKVKQKRFSFFWRVALFIGLFMWIVAGTHLRGPAKYSTICNSIYFQFKNILLVFHFSFSNRLRLDLTSMIFTLFAVTSDITYFAYTR